MKSGVAAPPLNIAFELRALRARFLKTGFGLPWIVSRQSYFRINSPLRADFTIQA